MKIYFAGSIRGVRNGREQYRAIIKFLSNYAEVLTEHVADDLATINNSQKELTDQDIHDRDLAWLNDADLIVAECSVPSLGVGYEIGRAIEMNKKSIYLYQKNSEFKLSAMVNGIKGAKIIRYESQEGLFAQLENYFDRATTF